MPADNTNDRPGGADRLMLRVIRDMKMMPGDVMDNGKTVARNAFEYLSVIMLKGAGPRARNPARRKDK